MKRSKIDLRVLTCKGNHLFLEEDGDEDLCFSFSPDFENYFFYLGESAQKEIYEALKSKFEDDAI